MNVTFFGLCLAYTYRYVIFEKEKKCLFKYKRYIYDDELPTVHDIGLVAGSPRETLTFVLHRENKSRQKSHVCNQYYIRIVLFDSL